MIIGSLIQTLIHSLHSYVYLSGSKTHLFANNLEVLGFQGSAEGLRPSLKHKGKIQSWPTLTIRSELDAYLWLTRFLRIFIPGRARLVMEMKKLYLIQVVDKPKQKLAHDDKMEEFDQDLTKPSRNGRSKRPSIRRKWVEKDTFNWGNTQQEAFEKVKQAISTNAMADADPDLQYHLATGASDTALGGCLFQLYVTEPGTEATPRLLPNERVIMFYVLQAPRC